MKALNTITGYLQARGAGVKGQQNGPVKTICIAGARQSDVDAVAGILRQAGMNQAKPAKREDRMDIAFWHEHVVGVGASVPMQAISNPGKLWEQMATEIFVANIEVDLWGWGDARSTWLLDYWLQYEPRLCFVLVCTPLQHMLASALLGDGDPAAVPAMVDVWQVHHQELLRFHRRYPLRTLLLDAAEGMAYPQALVERCAGQWNLPLSAASVSLSIGMGEPAPLALYLSQQVSQAYPQAMRLQKELSAAMHHLAAETQVIMAVPMTPQQIIAGYRQLQDRSTEHDQLNAAQEMQVRLQKEIAAFKDEKGTAQSRKAELEKQARREALEREVSALNKARETLEQEKAALTKARDEQTQLAADVQAKLDAMSKARDDQAKLTTDAQAKLDAMSKERDHQAHQAAERQKQIDALTKTKETLEQEKAALTKARDEQTKLATDIQAKVDAVTKERDSHAQQAAECQKQIDTLTKTRGTLEQEKVTLTKARDDQSKLVVDKQKQIDVLVKTQTQLMEATQESEMLLLQLHQVQEELEHYFLQHQDLESKMQIAEARWKRLLERAPDYCDYESIELLEPPKGDSHSARWRLKGLSTSERTLALLEFRTFVENGVACLALKRDDKGSGPLIYWPANSRDSQELLLMPLGSKDVIAKRLETLLELSTSDWKLLHKLTRLLLEVLDRPAALKVKGEFSQAPLRAGLEKLALILEKFPPSLRYDRISLKREQVNKDYEHLWLRLENMSLGDKLYPEFEFRLSCSNVHPDSFGNYPKLEFPEDTSQAPFENWFKESYDDFGAKLELRMELPQSMDMNVWKKLSDNDGKFVTALIRRLPAILQTLQSTGVQIKRSWDEWNRMVQAAQRIFVLNTAAVSKPPAIDRNIARTTVMESPQLENKVETETPTFVINSAQEKKDSRNKPITPASSKTQSMAVKSKAEKNPVKSRSGK